MQYLTWTTHHWVAVYIAAALWMLYHPPKAVKGVGQFIKTHFGDSMGVYLLHLAIGLIVLGSVYSIASMTQVGQTLLTTAMAILKFTKDAPVAQSSTLTLNSAPKP